MSLPGPSGGLWALSLLLWGLTIAVVGEPVRALLARWIPILRSPEPIERLLVNLYIGGAVFYLLAAVPLALFTQDSVLALELGAGIAFVLWVARARKRLPTAENLESFFRKLTETPYLLILVATFGLYLVEVLVAESSATGNTYDSSLFTVYVGLLLRHHTIPLSFQPVASQALLYPQGTTVWFAVPQLLFALPPARTSLLVTPLFLSLAPLGAFVLGNRLLGNVRGGAAFGITFALLGSWTRVLVGGSNDFVLAFPLVLLLCGWSIEWLRPTVVRKSDALAFGALVGYSSAMNPVGAQWLFLLLPIAAVLARSALGGHPARWLSRWGLAVLAALPFLAPSFAVLAAGHASAGFESGEAAPPVGTPFGITMSQFIGSIDPYLFRPNDSWLSPVPFLRAELAVLITVGVALLFLPIRLPGVSKNLRLLRSFLIGGIVMAVGLLGIELIASYDVPVAITLSYLTSAAELSILLFALFTVLAAFPIVLLFEYIGRRPLSETEASSDPHRVRRWRKVTSFDGDSSGGLWKQVTPIALASILLIPGAALTVTSLPPVLSGLYDSLGNVTGADFDLLTYSATHLPAAARVLVAPGSAAQFLPGYDSNVVLLLPMVAGWMWANRSYSLILAELSNGSLDGAGMAALAALNVGFVAVTGANTILWPPFSPSPLLRSSAFLLLFHESDAYLFERT